MSKKKAKNSDYRYLQRKEDERREAARKAEQQKNKQAHMQTPQHGVLAMDFNKSFTK